MSAALNPLKSVDVIGVQANRRGAWVKLGHFAALGEQAPYHATMVRIAVPSRGTS